MGVKLGNTGERHYKQERLKVSRLCLVVIGFYSTQLKTHYEVLKIDQADTTMNEEKNCAVSGKRQ